MSDLKDTHEKDVYVFTMHNDEDGEYYCFEFFEVYTDNFNNKIIVPDSLYKDFKETFKVEE